MEIKMLNAVAKNVLKNDKESAIVSYDDALRDSEEIRIVQAKCFMQKDLPFLYFLVARLKFLPWPREGTIVIPGWKKNKEIDPSKMMTCAVDSLGRLLWNPNFTQTLSLAELTAVMIHEVLHVAFQHLNRLGGRNREVMNWAADTKVNGIIQETTFAKLPENLIVADKNTHELTLNMGTKKIVVKNCNEKSVEQIYDDIMKQLPKDKNGKGSSPLTGAGGKGQFDSHSYGDSDGNENGEADSDGDGFGQGINDQSLEKSAQDWQSQIAAAASATRNRGQLPGQLEQMIHDLLNPTIPWKNLLHRFMTSDVFADFTWRRPSRRSQAVGLYLPSAKKENLDIIVAIDTSGSIRDEELNEFMTEICSIGNSFENVCLTAIVCDAQVHATFDLRGFDAKNASQHIKITGRGGTDHRPVAEWIKHNKPQAKAVVCFTDMATCFPDPCDKIGRWIWVATKGYGDESMCPEGDAFIKMRD